MITFNEVAPRSLRKAVLGCKTARGLYSFKKDYVYFKRGKARIHKFSKVNALRRENDPIPFLHLEN